MAGFTPVLTSTVLARTAGALFGLELSYTTMNSLVAAAGSTTASQTAFLNTLYANSVGASTANSVVVSVVMTNLGIPTTDTAVYGGVSAYIQAQLDAVPYAARGGVLNDALALFSTLTASPYVVAYNTKIAAAETYAAVSTNTSNASFDTVSSIPSTAGTTFTLTTTADNITGTANNDTINATGDSTPSLNASDVISAGSGTDTLAVTYTATDAEATNGAQITGVEIFNIRNTAAAATKTIVTLDASKLSGLTTANSNIGTGDTNVTNLATGAAVGIIGNSSIVNGGLGFSYKSATDAVTINLAGGVSQTAGVATLGVATATTGLGIINTGSGATTATINSTGAANVTGGITLSSSASVTSLTINAATALQITDGAGTADLVGFGGTAAKITVTGAATNVAATTSANSRGAVALGTIEAATVGTIDASGLTVGGIDAILNANTAISVTGGSGNDTITTGSVLTTGAVNGGAGTDTLDLGTNVAHANTASLAAKYTNFETLRVNGTFDASLISSITAIQLSGATNAITNLTATQAAAVTARAGIGATTLTLASSAGTADALTINLGTGEAADAATSTGVLTITGFETLNLKSNAGSAATAGANRTSTITGAIVDTSLTSIVLTGTSFVFTDIATTKAVNINGSALTGDGAATTLGLTVAGSATAGSTITGTNFVDSFTIGAEGSTYNAGSGNDTITVANTILVADGTTDVTIAGGAGTDTLTLTGAATVTDNNFTNVTGMEKLNTALTSAVSYTGLGAAAKAAFADGLTITSGTLADNATYTVGAGLYDKAVTLTLVSSGVGDAAADNIAITTGAGADNISVTASSWVGTAGAAGLLSVSTGAGNDTISVTTGTILAVTTTAPVIITGGTGADTITAVGVNAATGLTVTFAVAAGDSLVSAYDSITGFDMGTGGLFSSTLDLAGSPVLTAYTATAATGFTAAELTVAVSAAGLVTFAGTSAASATLAQKIAAVQSVVVTNNNDVALFTNGSNSYVFENNTTADSVIELVGVTGTSLVTANATTAGAIFVA